MRLLQLAGRWMPKPGTPTDDQPNSPSGPTALTTRRRPTRVQRLRRDFPSLPVIAARQLIASGHRTATSVAARSTAGLVADLRRWSLTSDGRRRMQRYPLPTADQLHAWLGRDV